MSASTGRTASNRVPRAHKQEFAPMSNRFSILEELEHSPVQSKRALDLAQPSSRIVRRRGKRAGKQNRLKYNPQSNRRTRKSEEPNELCEKFAAALSPSNKPVPVEPRISFINPTDTVRHHWAPQFRPNKNVEPVVSAKIFQLPESFQCEVRPFVSEVQEAREEGPHFFPLSAFLATTPTHKRSGLISSTPKSKTEAVPSAAYPPIADIAVLEHLPTASIQTTLPPSSPGQPSFLEPRSTLELTQFMGPLFSPLSITSPQTASPVLTKAPISDTSLLIGSPHIDFSESTHLSQADSWPFSPEATTVPSAGGSCDWRRSSDQGPTFPRSFTPASMTPTSHLMTPLLPFLPEASLSPDWKLGDEASRVPSLSRSPQGVVSSPSNSKTLLSVEEFLKLGHAKPCWCAHSSHELFSTEAPEAKSVDELEDELHNATNKTEVSREITYDSEREKVQSSVVLEEHGMQGRDLEAPSLRRSPIVPCGSESRNVFGFESPTTVIDDSVSTRSCNNIDSEDDSWAVVSSGDDRYPMYGPLPYNSEDEISEPEIIPDFDIASIPSPSLCSPPLSWALPFFDFESEAGPSQYESSSLMGLSDLPNLFNTWQSSSPSPTHTPLSTPMLPSTPPPTSTHSPKGITNTGSIEPHLNALDTQLADDRMDVAKQSTANASAVEWPTLQQAINMSKRRINMRYGMDNERRENWDGVADSYT